MGTVELLSVQKACDLAKNRARCHGKLFTGGPCIKKAILLMLFNMLGHNWTHKFLPLQLLTFSWNFPDHMERLVPAKSSKQSAFVWN